MEDLLKRSIRVTVFIMLIVSAVFGFLRLWRELFAFIVGNSWSILNFLLLASLLKIALQKAPKAKLFLLLLVKFPLLYLVGFFIVVTKFFPVWSLFLGLFSIIAVTLTLNTIQRQI